MLIHEASIMEVIFHMLATDGTERWTQQVSNKAYSESIEMYVLTEPSDNVKAFGCLPIYFFLPVGCL